jgi:hypothetical protein
MDSPEKFISAVQKGVATVEFRKIDTDELRIMPCTLNSEIAGKPIAVKEFDPASHHFAVWCIDKQAWRSFRVSTVERWYEGYPEGYEL